ncbi:MAG: hypothetical protein QOE96_1738 [Blastocatellia bacterium]|jgi:hypothetical protein|nr:hypothetical protein [Blastocatellia bacterium]
MDAVPFFLPSHFGRMAGMRVCERNRFLLFVLRGQGVVVFKDKRLFRVGEQ